MLDSKNIYDSVECQLLENNSLVILQSIVSFDEALRG
jgi:hypothetical protein